MIILEQQGNGNNLECRGARVQFCFLLSTAVYRCTHTHRHTYICITHVHIHIHITCMHTYTDTCTHIHTNAHKHTQIHIHRHTHIHTQSHYSFLFLLFLLKVYVYMCAFLSAYELHAYRSSWGLEENISPLELEYVCEPSHILNC